MSNMYYEREPSCDSHPEACSFVYRGCCLTCETDAGVFSKGELDEGTRLLLEALPELSGRVLDLGCGWGPVGTALSRACPGLDVTMTDVNLRALDLSRKNLQANGAAARVLESNGFEGLAGEKFHAVITNPPIRAGKQVVLKLLEDSAAALDEDGDLFLVVRKQQGADSILRFLKTLFPRVEILDRSKGFRVILASKREE